jgi:subtilisin family serine protease
MNVIPAWRKGYSGKGIVVSILDDGIQTNHPDLAQNYVSFPNLYYVVIVVRFLKIKLNFRLLQNKIKNQNRILWPVRISTTTITTRCQGTMGTTSTAHDVQAKLLPSPSTHIAVSASPLTPALEVLAHIFITTFESSYIVRCSFDFRRANVGRNSQRCCRGSRFEPQS